MYLLSINREMIMNNRGQSTILINRLIILCNIYIIVVAKLLNGLVFNISRIYIPDSNLILFVYKKKEQFPYPSLFLFF